MILNIIKHPNPVLRNKSRELKREEILNSDFKNFIENLGETMLKKDGIGLAAPQVYKNIRAIVVNLKNSAVCFINPKIIKKSWLKNIIEEGCLSIPGVFGKVKRHNSVVIKYLDLNADLKKLKAKNLFARVLQHEIDHLNGVLFIDKVIK